MLIKGSKYLNGWRLMQSQEESTGATYVRLKHR